MKTSVQKIKSLLKQQRIEDAIKTLQQKLKQVKVSTSSFEVLIEYVSKDKAAAMTYVFFILFLLAQIFHTLDIQPTYIYTEVPLYLPSLTPESTRPFKLMHTYVAKRQNLLRFLKDGTLISKETYQVLIDSSCRGVRFMWPQILFYMMNDAEHRTGRDVRWRVRSPAPLSPWS